jgi:hypothetical protein
MAVAADPRPRRLDLPPPYSLVTLRERGDAFAEACRLAPEAGAGTLVQVGRFDLIEFAVVLEPEEPLRTARRAFIAGMAALGDAIAAHCPPEKELAFAYPDQVLFNGGLVGGARLGWPEDAREEEPPDWLVFGAQLMAATTGGAEPDFLVATSLEEEGFDDGRLIVESFARHLMRYCDAWADSGFEPVAEAYLSRLPRKAGQRRGIDIDGDLLIRHREAAPPERVRLLPGLAAMAWCDPVRGGPRLR